MPKKTLAEELAELANPAPTKEHDPDADVFGAGPALESSDDELHAAPTRGRGKEAKKLQGDIVMEGKEYAGRRATRRSVFAQFEDNPVFSPQAGDADGSGSGSDSEGGSEGEDGSVDDDELQANGGGAASCDEDGPGGSSSDGRSGSESDGGGAASGGEEDDEMAALEREYESMAAAEVEASAGLRERAAKELRKARAVAAQRRVWQRALEARILLQRALAGAHRLPRGEGHAAVGAVDESLAGGLRGLAGDAAGLLGDLLGLLGALGDQNPALAAGQKRKREPAASPADDAPASERLWAALDESYRGFAPFRDASVDRWHRKTALAAGGGARGLKALNQSVSAQVGMVMADAGRVVERTRLPRRQCAVLCALEEEAKQDCDPSFRAHGAAGRPSTEAADGLAEERDPETYDDTEFYQTLLKEFLEGSGDVAGASNWYSGPKHRKAVDRRASKGRKLRYHIHEKLVNFVTPVELDAPQFASNIFNNLFGGGTAGGARRHG